MNDTSVVVSTSNCPVYNIRCPVCISSLSCTGVIVRVGLHLLHAFDRKQTEHVKKHNEMKHMQNKRDENTRQKQNIIKHKCVQETGSSGWCYFPSSVWVVVLVLLEQKQY